MRDEGGRDVARRHTFFDFLVMPKRMRSILKGCLRPFPQEQMPVRNDLRAYLSSLMTRIHPR